jgi:succinylglutamate desuccinylase
MSAKRPAEMAVVRMLKQPYCKYRTNVHVQFRAAAAGRSWLVNETNRRSDVLVAGGHHGGQLALSFG